MKNAEGRNDISITGAWTAITPLAQTSPDGEKGTIPRQPCAYQYNGSDPARTGAIMTANIPCIPGNKVRGLMRGLIGAQIVEKFAPGTMDFDTLFAMLAGGSYTAPDGNMTRLHENVKLVRDRNLLLDLLACATKQTGMMKGRLAVHNALVRCRELDGDLFPLSMHLVESLPFARTDPFGDYDVFALLSEEGLMEMARHKKIADETTAANKKAKAAAKSNGAGVKKDEVSATVESTEAEESADALNGEDKGSGNGKKAKAAQRPQILSTPAVAAGAVFNQRIYGWDVTDAQIGAMISVFRLLSRRPYIGGFSNKGFGEIEVELALRVFQGENTVGTARFGIKDRAFFAEGAEKYLAAWEAYLASFTSPDDIRIPAAPEKDEDTGAPRKKPIKRGAPAPEGEDRSSAAA